MEEQSVRKSSHGKKEKKMKEEAVRKSSCIKANQNKHPSKGITEILYKQKCNFVTFCEKKCLIKIQHRCKEGKLNDCYDDYESKIRMKGRQRLINMKQRSRPRCRNPFIIDEANENNKYFDEYYNKGLYSSKSDSDSDGKVKRN